MLFADRFEAGLLLASKLGEFRNRDDVVVLALPGEVFRSDTR